jgi:hypothetical protein
MINLNLSPKDIVIGILVGIVIAVASNIVYDWLKPLIFGQPEKQS